VRDAHKKGDAGAYRLQAVWDKIDRKMDRLHVEQIGVAHSKRDILVAKMDSMDVRFLDQIKVMKTQTAAAGVKDTRSPSPRASNASLLYGWSCNFSNSGKASVLLE